MKSEKLDKLSKVISFALRHNPQIYGLSLDSQGWCNLDDLVSSISKIKDFNELRKEDVIEMISHSKKKRHEIIANKIRALYGHSKYNAVSKEKSIPPVLLYHGTKLNVIHSIYENGLKPMNRQYVHLSETKKMAKDVADRAKGESVILKILSRQASLINCSFYKERNGVWLSDEIPPKFIDFNEII